MARGGRDRAGREKAGGNRGDLKEFRRSIYDPIHGFVKLNAMEDEILSTSYVQRLRYIKQLGLADMVFPTATHTRFSHSIGALHVASLLAERFSHLGYITSEDDVYSVRAATLLHDVGHTPFSHVLEGVILKRSKKGLSHEDITVKIIEETVIGDIMRDYGLDPKRVAMTVRKAHPNPATNYIISSPIDADRLDYLRRDAYYTGVNYGFIGAERIISLVELPYGEEVEGIVFPEKAREAVDNFFIGRYQMYRTVYTHRVSSAYSALLEAIYHGLASEGFVPGGEEVEEMVGDEERWFFFNDASVLSSMRDYLRRGRRACLREMIRAFFRRRKIPVVEVVYEGERGYDEILSEARSSEPRLDEEFRCPEFLYSVEVIKILDEGIEVFLRMNSGELVPISEEKSGSLLASIVASRGKRKERFVRKYRVPV